MQRSQIVGRVVAWALLIGAIVTGLFWFLEPADAPTIEQFGGAASIAGDLLIVAVIVGIAAMATVQFWKVVLRPRARFHREELEREFSEHLTQVLGVGAPEVLSSPDVISNGKSSDNAALDDLFDNPTEVVMGQIRTAADYILLRPKGFERALGALAGDAGKDGVRRYLSAPGDAAPGSPAGAAPIETQDSDRDEALSAVRFFVEQRLNLLHVALKERWRRKVRIIAVVVAGSAGLLIISLSGLGPIPKLVAIGAAVMWGGFFAWFARDVVALVERRRP